MPKKGKGREALGHSAELFRHYCDQKKITPAYEWSQIKQFNWNGSPGWRCTLGVVGMGQVEGTGGSKKDAQNAACHEFVSRLQARGIVLQLPRGKGGTAAPSWAIHGPSVIQGGPAKKQQKTTESQGPTRPPARSIAAEMGMMLAHVRAAEPEKALEVAETQLAKEEGVMSVKQLASLVTAVGVRTPEERMLKFFDGLLTLGVVDFPNSSAATYFGRFSRWAMREFMAEGKSCAEQASTMIPQLLERNGSCIQLLNVTQGNGSNELHLVPPGGQLPERHSFQRGDWVFVTSPHTCQVQTEDAPEGQERRAITFEGELSAFLPAPQTGLVVKIAGSGTKNCQKLVGGTCRIDRAANSVTFSRQVHALYMLCTEPGDLDWLSLALMAAEAGGDFEKVAEYCGNPPPSGGFRSNPQILASANASQFEALKAATNRRMTLIQGPPGAGKTSTAIMLMRLWVASGRKPVMATADSNIAVDNLVAGCAGAALKVTRVGRRGMSRPDLDGYNLFDKARAAGGGGGERYNWKAEKKILEASDVVCCTCSGAEHPAMKDMYFANVLVDEAAQTTELATLVPFLHLKADGCAVLVGDHRQLPATVACLEADVEGLGTSLFERMANLGVKPMLLDIQYRMHPALAIYPSQQYYGGRLRSGIRGTARRAPKGIQWPVPEAPIAFLPVQGQEIPEGNSYTNTAEANSIVELLHSVLNGGDLAPSSIGVITPYAAQARLLRTFLGVQGGKQAPGSAATPEVSSVDGFQGREKDLILVSTVRANRAGKVGFVGDRRRLNVTLTRARRGLVVVGDFQTLSNGPEGWRPWLVWAQERGLIVGCEATAPDAAEHLQRLEGLTDAQLLAMGPQDGPSSGPAGLLGSGGPSMLDASYELPGREEPAAPKVRPKSMLMQIREEAERAAQQREETGEAVAEAGELALPESVASVMESPWGWAGQPQPEEKVEEEQEEHEEIEMEQPQEQGAEESPPAEQEPSPESESDSEEAPGPSNLAALRDLASVFPHLHAGDVERALEAARKRLAGGGGPLSLEQVAALLATARLQAGRPALRLLEGLLAGRLAAFPSRGAGAYFARFGRWLARELYAGVEATDTSWSLHFEVKHSDGAVIYMAAPDGRLPDYHGLQEGDRLLLTVQADEDGREDAAGAEPLEVDLQEFLPPPHAGLMVLAIGPAEEAAARLVGSVCRVDRVESHAAFCRQVAALQAFCSEPGDLEWLSGPVLAAEEEEGSLEVAECCNAAPESDAPDLTAKAPPATDTAQFEVLTAATSRRLTLVEGPPGTGKTRTSVQLMQQWVASDHKPVLAVANSNAAVDQLVSACAGAGLKVVRLGIEEESRPSLSSYSLLAKAWAAGCPPFKQPHSWKGSRRIMEEADVVCCSSLAAEDVIMRDLKFPRIVADDATQATEPAMLVPMSHLQSGGCAVFTGDARQLAVATLCAEAGAEGLGVSLFERLVGLGVEPLRLRVQYRMHPAIADFPSRWQYDGQLRSGIGGSGRPGLEGISWPSSEVPIAFLPLQGEEHREEGSYRNDAEAAAILELLAGALQGGDVAPGEVGVIAACRAQAWHIQNLIQKDADKEEMAGVSQAQVGVAEDFQGCEKDLILVSTVRTNKEWEASSDADLKRLNVTLTRARRGLVVCGDFDTLSRDDKGWRPWLAWAQRRGLIAGNRATAPAAASALRRLDGLPAEELLTAGPTEDGVLGEEVPAKEAAPAPAPAAAPEEGCAAAVQEEVPAAGPRKRRRRGGPAGSLEAVASRLRAGEAAAALALAREELGEGPSGALAPGKLPQLLGALALAEEPGEVERFVEGVLDLGAVASPSGPLGLLFRRLTLQALADFLAEGRAAAAAAAAATPQVLESTGNCVAQLQVSHANGTELHLVPESGQLPERHNFLVGDRVFLTSPCLGDVCFGAAAAAAGGSTTVEGQVQAFLHSPEAGVAVEVLGPDAAAAAQRLEAGPCRMDRAAGARALGRRLAAAEALCADLGELSWLGPALLQEGPSSISEELVAACSSTAKGGGFQPTSQVLSSASRAQFDLLRAAAARRLTLVRGAPGSGKTRTAVLLAHLWVTAGRGPVLATAGSEAAAAELAAGCAGAGLRVVLLGGRAQAKLDPKGYGIAERAKATGLPCGEEDGWQGERKALDAAEVVCCSLPAAAHPALEGRRFGGVLVDGAEEASEAATLLPLVQLQADGCITLFGDPPGPPAPAGASLFERLTRLGVEPLELAVQHRAHPALAAYASKKRFGGLLRSGVCGSARKPPQGIVWPVEEAAIAFLPLDGQECAEGSSFSNNAEAEAIVDLLDGALSEGDLRPSEVGIITPWAAQARLIRKILETQWPLMEISKTEIGDVGAFQGREKELILVSTVRTNKDPQTSSPADHCRLSTLLSRARRGLVVCGAFGTLARDTSGWRPWLCWAQQRGLIVGCAATSPAAVEELRRLDGLSESELLEGVVAPAPAAEAPRNEKRGPMRARRDKRGG